jgi:ABC-type branched-subunit amino acid transport system substrate-binding protein
VEKFKAAGFNPEAYTLYSYAAVQVIAGAAAAKSNDPAEVAKATHAGTFPTVLGEMGFDERAIRSCQATSCMNGSGATTASTPTKPQG